MKESEPSPQILTPCSSGRYSISIPNSPEFEFWMLRNPSIPQPNLTSADELFSNGVLLPFHPRNDPPPQPHEASVADQLLSEPEPPAIDTLITSSKRWSYIFKKDDIKASLSSINTNAHDDHPTKEKNRKKKKLKKNSVGGGVAAELNIINIWPFSRSRSAGNGQTRPCSTAANSLKVSSAPCTRSNSKARKWPNSPTRGGVHLGRSSPVWQPRRRGGGRSSEQHVVNRNGDHEKAVKNSTTRLLSLNVPMCIGYRHNLTCRSDENSKIRVAAVDGGGGRGSGRIGGTVSGEGVRRSHHLFNIRNLFTKKVF